MVKRREIVVRQSAITIRSKLLKTYNPNAMRPLMRSVTTITQAKALGTESLSLMCKSVGITNVEALIKIYLINLNDLLNLRRPMTEAQIDEIASDVVSAYYTLSVADVCLIMKRARMGAYGEFYESLNPPKVMIWFKDYFKERCEVGATASLDKHTQHKERRDPNCKPTGSQDVAEFSAVKSEWMKERAKRIKDE